MPRARSSKTKQTRSTKSKTVPQPALSKAYGSEISYETRMIVIILLLLFFYPIGLIFMWLWMRDWPIWLKLLISLPLFLGVLAFFGIMIALGTFLGQARWQYQREQMQQRMQERQELRLNPTVSPMMRMMITPTPTEAVTPNTY